MVKVAVAGGSEALNKFLRDNPEWVTSADLIALPPDAAEIADHYPEADRELLSRCMEMLTPMITRGAQYMRMRHNRESDSMAAMVAMQKSAGLDTDDTFFSGSKPLYDQFESSKMLDRHLAVGKRLGFTPSANATYFPNLARFKGDPEAYVTRAQGRSYIRKLLETRGWSAEGGVNVKGREPESDPLARENCKPLGNDIIRERMQKMVSTDPSLRRVDRKELRRQIVAQHGPTH